MSFLVLTALIIVTVSSTIHLLSMKEAEVNNESK